MVAGYPEVAEIKEVLIAGARNHPITPTARFEIPLAAEAA
jgi:hypothetical protein